ncbi:MAG: IS4 family transposase [Gemmatimonas sp.]|nr:IS4 family transposase [Gemmatimonas sp.]
MDPASWELGPLARMEDACRAGETPALPGGSRGVSALLRQLLGQCRRAWTFVIPREGGNPGTGRRVSDWIPAFAQHRLLSGDHRYNEASPCNPGACDASDEDGSARSGSAVDGSDHVGRALVKNIPMEAVRRSLEVTGRQSQRVRDLPAQLMMYYVIALGLFRSEEMREVLRLLLEGGRAMLGWAQIKPAGRPAITRARQRLGLDPLRHLYAQVVGPIATDQTQGAWYRKWRTVALDGTTLEVADSDENEKAFGRPYAQRGQSANPRVRVVGLVETGTHVLFAAEIAEYYTSEKALAQKVIDHLRPGMLCLADRLCPGYALWKQTQATGADLVWRIQEKVRLEVVDPLADGSHLCRMYLKWDGKRPVGEPVLVRSIDYELEGSAQRYRLVTTILDPEEAPAQELAELYWERWEFETALDEFKTHLRGARTPLRSQRPELVRQEVYGLLLAHFALRCVMHEAALRGGRDPDRISFLHTVRVIKRSLPRFAALPPSGVDAPVSDDPR